jgi:hypothetical protein
MVQGAETLALTQRGIVLQCAPEVRLHVIDVFFFVSSLLCIFVFLSLTTHKLTITMSLIQSQIYI